MSHQLHFACCIIGKLVFVPRLSFEYCKISYTLDNDNTHRLLRESGALNSVVHGLPEYHRSTSKFRFPGRLKMDMTVVIYHGGIFNMHSNDDTNLRIYRSTTKQLFFRQDISTRTYTYIKGLFDDVGYNDVQAMYYRNFDGVMKCLHADEPNIVLTQITLLKSSPIFIFVFIMLSVTELIATSWWAAAPSLSWTSVKLVMVVVVLP